MTHKQAEPHPSPSPWPLTHIFSTFLRISTSLSTVGSSKSCTRKLFFRRGVSHCTQLPEPRTNSISTQFSHLWVRRGGNKTENTKLSWMFLKHVTVYSMWQLRRNFPQRKASLCFFLPASYHQAQRVIMERMTVSSECSKMAGIMIGMSFRLPPTLRQEEISLTPHQWSVCLPWKNICFIVISVDLSHSATLHNVIKSRTVIHSAVCHYKNGQSLT